MTRAQFDLAAGVAAILSDPMFNPDLAGMFTCAEAELVARFLDEFSTRQRAREFLESHIAYDDDEDQHRIEQFDVDAWFKGGD